MKTSKKILNLNLQQQIDLLTKRVYITNEAHNKKQGIIVSIKLNGGFYWVLLDDPFETKHGKRTRRLFISEKYVKLVD